ncbi:E3 ubiquitin-protein ligase RBX1 [Oryzias melastigma]|uniref:E3 ubiquitin-protein ligase RBX1 n=1 Tax=Oryzias melastigma TaxID=30732 RepID=A0A834F448_ORYME|nr:E3 ubiquitin-protein ligase RBX1 [Oryzias melastigma]
MAAAMDVDTPSGANSGSSKKRFEVKKWNAVALWAWDIVVDNCAICRNHIMDLSCFPFPLYFPLVEDQTGVSPGQQRVGVSELTLSHIDDVDSAVILFKDTDVQCGLNNH